MQKLNLVEFEALEKIFISELPKVRDILRLVVYENKVVSL